MVDFDNFFDVGQNRPKSQGVNLYFLVNHVRNCLNRPKGLTLLHCARFWPFYDVGQNRPKSIGVNLYFLVNNAKNCQNRPKSKGVNPFTLWSILTIFWRWPKSAKKIKGLPFTFWSILANVKKIVKVHHKVKGLTFTFLSTMQKISQIDQRG